MKICVLDSSTGTVHLFKTRGRNADKAVEHYLNSRQHRMNPFWHDCEWMEFKRIQSDGFGLADVLPPRPKVIIDVKGGVAHVRSAPKGVNVKIVDHDKP